MAEYIRQTLQKRVESDMVRAIKYYSILSILNNLNWTPKQVEILAFTAVHGSITSVSARKEFVEQFDSSAASLANMKGKLVKSGWLVKSDENKHKVNSKLNLDFSKNIVLQINLLKIEDEPSKD